MTDSGWIRDADRGAVPPSSLVLHRTSTGWRYTIYFGEYLDGRLDLPDSASEVDAQSALVELVESKVGTPVRVSWQSADADWWFTDVERGEAVD